MKSLFFFLFLLPLYLFGELDGLFSADEDPTVFHHVNVISGQLNLSIEDTTLQGAHPFSLMRTYSSSGAFENTQNCGDIISKILRRDWIIQGGWNFLPHANLLVLPKDKTFKPMQFRLPEPSGAVLSYTFSHKEFIKGQIYYYYYKPEKKAGSYSGILSARHDPQNNLLRVRVDKGYPEDFEVTVFLATGGVRHYRKLSKKFEDFQDSYYYKLILEELPSKRCIEYKYDAKDKLFRIEVKNPARTKMHSWIQFDVIKDKAPFEFKATTSDNRSFIYKAVIAGEKEYIEEIISTSKRQEKFLYSRGHSGMGSRVSEILFENKGEVEIRYYDSPKNPSKRDANFYKKNPSIDKVDTLEASVGPRGEKKRLAKFYYNIGYTDVQDVDGALIRYHYPEGHISRVEHFHKDNGPRHSILDFIWNDGRMVAKVLSDGTGTPIFSKTFQYDKKGNVKKETLWGNLTGQANQELFELNTDGSLSQAESCFKYYKYEPITNLLSYEEEEDGLSYDYAYLPTTDLLISKFTKKDNRILKREFFVYNEDHFLIEEIVDDGSSSDIEDLNDVSQRHIKRYEIDGNLGFTKSLTELYLDGQTGNEVLLKKHDYTYQSNNLKSEEKIYDANLDHRYTLLTRYDERGHIDLQTTPLGEENTYRHDNEDHLTMVHEVGLPKKHYRYDRAGRVLSCQEYEDRRINFYSGFNSKTSYNTYDCKGRVLSQTDFLGNVTYQTYDTFGKCIKTEFPEVKDEEGNVYTPTIHFTYDVVGNLTSHTNPKGETTQTEYNVYGKPIRIVRPDKTVLLHIYNKNGTLATTIQPDQTKMHYSYDPFLRMSSKVVYDATGDLLSLELWDYGTFQLRSHTDENGLITTFSYDGSGKKITESSEGRSIFYAYDPLGFLETRTYGDISKVEIHDVQGNVIEKFEKKGPHIENHTKLQYKKGLLEKTYRTTSQGEVMDEFSYDAEKRLCEHVDPLGEKTQFLYHPIKNDLGQFVFCKTTINALNAKTIEIDDAQDRLVSREKQDEHGKTLSLEEFFYDLAGNKSKRISTVYLKDAPLKKITHLSEYDPMGRVLKEIEAGKKITSYSYDDRGRIKTKTLSSGITLTYDYDGVGRLTSLKSSDGSVHYRYSYKKGNVPFEGEDVLRHQKITRSYNLFQELEEESSSSFTLSWNYDEMGRCDCFTLPDSSFITYEYLEGHLYSITRKDESNTSRYSHTYLKMDPNNHVEEEKLIYNLGTLHTSHDLLERPSLQTSKWNTHQVFYDPLGRVYQIESSLFPEKKISYDPLNQIRQEGDKVYLFDSIGNSSDYKTNDCNEVLSTQDSHLIYDPDGNLIERILKDQTILYSYDALNRLTSITYPKQKKITYLYDAFSRLSSKETHLFLDNNFQKAEEVFFLYDQDKEIGILNNKGKILQLKVLGLGLGADIGAAVALELNDIVYAPLHDFSGNCVALLSTEGKVVELYQIDAFGKEIATPSSPENPWRFSSKRQEEGLVFFGLRFYDLALERWLTPDPSGFADGPNLYAYVGNSPLNRLDLFGLNSLDANPMPVPIIMVSIANLGVGKGVLVPAVAIIEGVRTDWFVACGHFLQLQYSVDEAKAGEINLLNHFPDLMPSSGGQIGLVSLADGICTSLSEFKEMAQSIINKNPEGTLFLGMHTPSCCMQHAVDDTMDERNNIATPSVRANTQMMGAIAETIHKINPGLIWLDIRHSRAGVTGRRAIERLTEDQKQIFKNQYYCLAIGPAKLIPDSYGLAVYNIYSDKDHVTKRYAKETNDGFSYNVKFLQCQSSIWEKTGFIADHAFMGTTYQMGILKEFEDIRKDRGFYNGSKR